MMNEENCTKTTEISDTDAIIPANTSDSNETLKLEKSTTGIDTMSSSSSSSIQPISLDETSKLSDINILQTNQQNQASILNIEKRDEIYKENYLADNFQEFFVPLIKNLDVNVATLRTSQIELGSQIDLLANQMRIINENLQKQIDLDEYTKRLLAAKKRVNNVLAMILAVEERMSRIYSLVKKDAALQQQQQQQNISQSANDNNQEIKLN